MTGRMFLRSTNSSHMRVSRALKVAVALVALCAFPATRAFAQDQTARIRAQRDTLERIRREREDLERRAAELQTSVHDLNEEVTNLDRQRDATARIVKTLDQQLASISVEADSAAGKVTQTETQLETKKRALHKRLVDIYKRGPLYTTEALLSARSFGELVARYKYLHILTLHDRALVGRVEQLRDEVKRSQDQVLMLRSTLEESRSDKQREEDRLRSLEHERQSNLTQTRAQAKQTDDRLASLKETEAELGSALASFEASRRAADAARPAATRIGSTIKTSDYGKLDWPVDGSLIYTFGKAQTATNTTIRWNGVGIKATANAEVRAVAPGHVVSVGQLGTYGLTVIVDHGGGDYSIYGSLSRVAVRPQAAISKGQIIGAVGVSDPDLPPHLHFEIRHAGPDGRPGSVDPATWLREQR
jgi:septal ring factor EnvC (AmiA/AmiB activator)